MTPSSSDFECPEKRLLVCCARTRLEPAFAAEIRELACEPIDWEFLLAAAAENSILPLLTRNLVFAAADVVPSSQLERLRAAARANTVRCLLLAAELIKILELFNAQGVQAISYKGPLLAVDAYGDLTLREFDDLDIVLRQSEMPKANAVMQSLGYRTRFPWIAPSDGPSAVVPGEYKYVDEARRLIVELHTDWTLRHFPVRPDFDGLFRRLAQVALSGHEIATFGAEDMLPILCIHGSKDFWERISWIADISEFVQSHRQLDWDGVFQSADTLRGGRMLHIGLALAERMLGMALPDEVGARVRRDTVAVAVASEVAQFHLRRHWPGYDTAARFGYRRRMVAGTFAGWRYAMRLATQPADEDRAMMRLPRPLAPFYAVLRPLRLLRKYGSPAERPARPR